MSALELLASKAAPAISACEMHGVVCGFCITQPFGYAMEELIELFGNEEVVDQEMLDSFDFGVPRTQFFRESVDSDRS